MQAHLARDAADREVAHDGERLALQVGDPAALEPDRGEGVRVEEIGRAQVCVALRLARIDARHADLDVDLAAGGIAIVAPHRTADLGEPALDGRDHQMANRKLHVRVGAVDAPARAGFLQNDVRYWHVRPPSGYSKAIKY